MRLRGRLLCLIVAALLPAVAMQIDFEHEAREARKAAQREEALRFVRLVAADLDSAFDGARQFLSALANLDELASGDGEACSRTLTALGRDVPRYASFAVLDAQGIVTCSATPDAIGQDASLQPFFHRAREGSRFAVGDFVPLRGTGRPGLPVAVPLTQERHGREGVVAAALDLDWLASRLGTIPLPPGGSAIVLDRHGTVLGRWPEPERFIGRPAQPQLKAAIARTQYQVSTGPGIDGVVRTYAVAPIGLAPEGLAVGIGLDPAPAEASLAAANRRGLLLITLSGLCALLLASVAARRFLEQPVEALASVMERWRAGDRTARALAHPHLRGLGPNTEFGHIAAIFDQATTAVEAREAALRESEARFHQVAGALDDALLISEPRQRRIIYASPAFGRLLGVTGDPLALPFRDMMAAVHPDDRDRVRAHILRPPEDSTDFEYRLRRSDGEERRLRHRRFPTPDLASGRVVTMISDVTEEREAAERQTLLAREVDHRAKNILSVVQSILRLTRADSPRAFAQAVEGRVAALARAHQLLARSRWAGADLVELLHEEFAPFAGGARERSRAARRFLLQGPPIRLRPDAVQPLAMIVHELATNSAKHGALSVPAGSVHLAWALEEGAPGEPPRFRLHWEETGGPRIAAVPERIGFGSRVVAATVERQLGGTVRYAWDPAGLRCVIAFPAERLVSPGAAAIAGVLRDGPFVLAGGEAPGVEPAAAGPMLHAAAMDARRRGVGDPARVSAA